MCTKAIPCFEGNWASQIRTWITLAITIMPMLQSVMFKQLRPTGFYDSTLSTLPHSLKKKEKKKKKKIEKVRFGPLLDNEFALTSSQFEVVPMVCDDDNILKSKIEKQDRKQNITKVVNIK